MNTYSYDAAGNLLTATGGTYGYDAENRLASAPGVTFDYDADGRRVQKATSSTAGTLYWYGKDGEPLVETDLSGNLKNEYVFFNGERVARRDASANVFYYFEDELGSSRIITNATGTVCYDADLYPFGAEQYVYTNNCPQNYKFTGKERDAETGLDEFGARYYASFLGRFVTPDWAAKPTSVPYAKFGDPQTLNLYSYVENSPVNRADADGHTENDCTACKDGEEWIQQQSQALEQKFGAATRAFTGAENDFIKTYSQEVASNVPFSGVSSPTTNNSAGKAGMLFGFAAGFAMPEGQGSKAIGATGKLGEQALKTLGGDSKVFFRTTDGARFVDQLVNEFAHESKVGYKSLTSIISRQIGKDAELVQNRDIQGAIWHFFQSPITRKGGPSEPLRQALRKAGIKVLEH